MGKWLNFTFALTGRMRLCIDTQGVALGCGLAALSGRSFSRFVRLSCAHALPPRYLLSKPHRDFLDFAPQPFNTHLISVAYSNNYSATH